jgi:hypothetical protein
MLPRQLVKHEAQKYISVVKGMARPKQKYLFANMMLVWHIQQDSYKITVTP